MAASFETLFRTLTSFEPARTDLSGAPWESFCDWAIAQGLASLAAYNLEYRLGAVGAPTWVRDRWLSLHQGTATDNVMKLVNLKHALAELHGRKIVLLGGASFAESVYPHIAFRPLMDIRLLVAAREVEPLGAWLKRAEFAPIPNANEPGGATCVLSDTRTTLLVHGGLTGDASLDLALLERAEPMRPFGPSVFRLGLEDALVAQALVMARAGFEVPMLEFIDVRELVLGAPSMGGAYSRVAHAERVAQRASEWKAERALWCVLSVVQRLWPETEAAAERLKPSLSLPVREVLERLVVAPMAQLGRTEGLKGASTLRSLLAGD